MSLESPQAALKKAFRQSLALECAVILFSKRKCSKLRSLLALLPQVLVWCLQVAGFELVFDHLGASRVNDFASFASSFALLSPLPAS